MERASEKILTKSDDVISPAANFAGTEKTNYVFNNLLGLLFYVFSFFLFYFIKRKTLIIESEYYLVFGTIVIAIITGSILSNKGNLNRKNDFRQIFRTIYISLILSLGALSLLFFLFKISFASRFMLLGTFIFGSTMETTYYIFLSERRKKINLIEKTKLSLKYLIIDWMILTSVHFFKILLPYDYSAIDKRHVAALFVCYMSWIFSAFITHKFNPIQNSKNKWHAFGLQLKFYLLNMSLVAISIYILQISAEYWRYFTESTLIYTGISLSYFIYKFSERITNKTDEAAATFLKSYEMKSTTESSFANLGENKYRVNGEVAHESNLRQVLQFEYLSDYENIFNFLDRKVELKAIDANKSTVLRTLDSYNISVLTGNSHEFIMNLHELNDFRKINDYLRLVNHKLKMGGVFVGCFIPNKNRYTRFLSKYTFLVGNVFYFFDFLWKRVIPKLPFFRNFYLKITKGKDRALSLTEGLGRLVFCGFEILDILEINNQVFYATRKINEPMNEKNPPYSTIFKMRRVGKNGKTIFVYKLRTMHPYAEYLQEFIYINNKLEGGGKFKSDFRIPVWGRVFRQLWIDELPMIYNWLKRELKLVGVRPISRQYLNLYSKEHQTFRMKFKPGLIPPFYADLPKTIEEIESSEARYLKAFKEHPLTTDIKYFLMILNNIVLKKKRSA